MSPPREDRHESSRVSRVLGHQMKVVARLAFLDEVFDERIVHGARDAVHGLVARQELRGDLPVAEVA